MNISKSRQASTIKLLV